MMKTLYAGVDVGGTSAKIALVDDEGAVLSRRRFPTGPAIAADTFIAGLVREVQLLSEEAASLGGRLAGIGLGIPGLVSLAGIPVNVVNLPVLSGRDISAELQACLHLPVCLLNDATAAAYGEYVMGAGRGCDSMVMMTLGTGIGGGLVLQRRLWVGADGMAGEVGHLTVEPAGRPCSCGNTGCLEQYASASAVGGAWLRATGAEGTTLSMTEAAMGAAEAARRGDHRALAIFAEAGRYLGIAVAGIANLLNMEAVIFGGGLSGSMDLLRTTLMQEVGRRAFPRIASRLSILQGTLGDDAGTIGIVAYMRSMAPHGAREEM